MSTKILNTAPSGYPITLAQVKEFGFINDTSYDDLITSLIPAAVSYIESKTGRVLINQTWDVYFDIPALKNSMNLNTLNVTAINSVTSYDQDNTATLIASTNYRLFNNKLIFNYDYTFSGLSFRNEQALQVEVTAGYGADDTAQPVDIQSALAQLIIYWTKTGSASHMAEELRTVPIGVDSKIFKYISYVGRI